jgi:hypothetical protein
MRIMPPLKTTRLMSNQVINPFEKRRKAPPRDMLLEIKRIETNYQPDMKHYEQTALVTLLAAYKEYTAAQENTKNALTQLAMATTDQEKVGFEKVYLYWVSILKDVGENMKFNTPAIWIRYKTEAYKNTPNEILTLADLIQHSLGDDSICGERLKFLDEQLQNTYSISLFNESDYSLDIMLTQLVEDPILSKLMEDIELLQKWYSLEHFKTPDGKVDKWMIHTKKI